MVATATENAQVFLKHTKFDSVHTVINILIDTILCIATFFVSAFILQTLIVSLILSAIVGIVCVIRFNGFKKFYAKTNLDELDEKTKEKLKGYKKLFDKDSLVLSILDFVSTFIIIITIGLFVQEKTATLSGMIIRGSVLAVRAGNNAIQLGKLVRALRGISLVSGFYILARNKKNKFKGENMKNWLKANKLSILSSVGMGGVVATASWFLLSAYWATAPLYASILITAGAGLLSLLLIYFLGAEKVWQYVLRVATKYLPAEKVAELTNVAKTIETELKDAKAKEEVDAKAKAELEATQKQLEAVKQAIIDAETKKAELESKITETVKAETTDTQTVA